MLSRTTQPLTGLTILLLGSAAVTRMSGMWLLASGARVVHRLSGSADHEDDVVATYVAHGVDPFDPEDRFDAVVFTPEVAHELEAVTSSIDRADQIEITSPYPESGDFVRSAITDMQLWARSGLGYLTRHMDASGEMTAIAIPRNRQASILGGALSALAIVTQQLSKALDDKGAPVHIRLDLLELLAMLPMQPIGFAQLDQRIVGEPSPAPFRMPGGTMTTRNGLAFVRPVEPAHWSKLLHLVGVRADLSSAVANDLSLLRIHVDEINESIRAWAAMLTSEEVSDVCQDEHIPVAPVHTASQVAADLHMNTRGFFKDGRVGLPWLASLDESHSRKTTRKSAIRPEQGLPLSDLRVLDLSWAWAGPYATTLLSDLGAEVINVEWHPRASNLRRNPPFAEGKHESNNTAAWWSANQRGKFSIGVNMKSEEGRKIIRELAAQADVVVENFAPGVVDRLGVGYDALREVNPELVYVSLSAFGQVGPRSHYIGYGTQVYAASGAGYATSLDEVTASQMFIPYPDPVSGLCGSLAIAAYIWKARTTGCNARVDVSELETVAMVGLEPLLAGLDPSREILQPEYVVAESRDREPVALFAVDDDEWRRVVEALTDSEETNGMAPARSPSESIAEIVATLDKDDVLSRIGDKGLAAAWVRHSAQVLDDEYLKETALWEQDCSPEVVKSDVNIAGSLWKLDGERTKIWRGSPRLFSDTSAVLIDLLGYTAEQVVALNASGAIAVDSP